MKPYIICRNGTVLDRRNRTLLGHTFKFSPEDWEATLPGGERLMDSRYQADAANDLYLWWKIRG